MALAAGYSLTLDSPEHRATYLNGGSWTLVAEFVEVESGKHSDRPQLAACKKHRAKLVIAKLDRLSRNLAFIAALMDSGVEFIAVDNPHANKLTIHILAAVAQHEREMIAQRTKDALQAAKARGKRLGNPKLGEARKRAIEGGGRSCREFIHITVFENIHQRITEDGIRAIDAACEGLGDECAIGAIADGLHAGKRAVLAFVGTKSPRPRRR
jgi:DNA invertase Pin-like site-specific DNA recombinase